MKKEKFDIVGVILTFLLACITFFSYMYNQMIYDSGLHAQIYSLFEEVGITEGRENIFLYMIFFVCLIVLLLIGFFAYKIILKLCRCKIADVKLIIAVETGYAVSFFVAGLLLGLLPLLWVVIIGNIVETLLVVVMCYDNIKRKIGSILIMKTVLIVLNVVVSL